MGRHLPWRKTLIFLLLTLPFLIGAAPLEPVSHPVTWKQGENLKASYLPALQGHEAPEIYSLDIPKNNHIELQIKKADFDSWQKYLLTTSKRMEPYRDHIVSELEKRNMPIELQFLPIIESGARPHARSHRGAVGLWQFMLNSIGPYDIKYNEWVDERRDFIKSTDAALRKLSYNYRQTGDWLLALAAYNCGLNRVKTTIKRTGINDFWTLSEKKLLPGETRNYIPKFLAVTSMLSYKGKYDLPFKWTKEEWSTVTLQKAVDIRMLSDSAGIPFTLLQEANAELNYYVTPPASTRYALKVPSAYKDNLIDALENEKELIEFYRYKVRSGDTLSEIGYHYGVSVNTLKRYNRGLSDRNLRIGRNLLIPALKKVGHYRKATSSRPFNNTYTVKDGDTLWEISLFFNTTVDEIADNNNMDVNTLLKKGMVLKVP